MADSSMMLIRSLIKDGKSLATLLTDAKSLATLPTDAKKNPNNEKLKEIQADVTTLISQILKQIQDVQLPASFPEKIISKILEKIQTTLQKFTELDPENASDYTDLIGNVNACKSQMNKKMEVGASSSGVPQQIEPPIDDSTQIEGSSSELPQHDEFRKLSKNEKKCLFCFCLFPAEEEIKKREPLHLWVAMDLIDDPLEGAKMLDKLVGYRFIERNIANEKMFTRYKMNEQVRSMIVNEMQIKFSNDSSFDIMDQKPLQEQATTSEQPEQQQQQQPEQEQPQQKSLLPNMSKKMSFRFGSADIKQKNQSNLEVSGALVLNKTEKLLQPKTLEKISEEANNVKILLLGNCLNDSKKYIVIEEVEAALKALKRYMGQVTLLSLQGISGIVNLQDLLYKLDKLKVLDLRGCPNLESLSNGIELLKQLTHLDLSECYLLDHIPKGIASLTNLRVLKGFVINPEEPSLQNGNTNRNSSCASFSDLKKLVKLVKLTVRTRRRNFPTSNDFETLRAMLKLTTLKIVWVQNPTDVQTANTSGRFPKSIKKLELQATPKDTMPRLLKLISDDTENSLQKLYIRGGRFWDLGKEEYNFSHVDKVRLRYLPELRMDWFEFNGFFPNLNRLEVIRCPNLSFFPCDKNNGVWEET